VFFVVVRVYDQYHFLYMNQTDTIVKNILKKKEWHLTDTNNVLLDIFMNVNLYCRCFHRFLSNMTRYVHDEKEIYLSKFSKISI
jgi:hypothetical protein